MDNPVPCPRCTELRFHQMRFKHGCLLCDDRQHVSPQLDAAYRLLRIDITGIPDQRGIERIRGELGE